MPDLKVQLRAVCIRAPQLSDRLPALDRLLFGNQHFAVVRVCSDEVVAMAHDHQVAIAAHRTSDIDDFTIGRGLYWRAFIARDIDALVARIIESFNDLAGCRPKPWQRCSMAAATLRARR